MNQPEEQVKVKVDPVKSQSRVYVCAKCGLRLGLKGTPPAVKIGVAQTPHGPQTVYAHKVCPDPQREPRARIRWPKR